MSDGGFVCFGRHDQLEGIVLSPGIVCDYLQVAGITGFAVFREIHELYGISVDTAFPNLIGEAFRTAVQVVGTVVDGKRIFNAVQGELATGDAVGVATGNLSGKGTVAEVTLGVLVSQGDIPQFAVLVGNDDGNDACTYAAQLYISAGGILKGIEEDFLTVGRSAPEFFIDSHSPVLYS